MSSQQPSRGIIFDLGDVLFTWSAHTTTTVSAGTLRKILTSSTWLDYECGRVTQVACYEKVARQFDLEASEVADAFTQAHASLQPNDKIVAFLRALKKSSSVKVYAMSNIAIEDFAALSDRMDWSLFDDVFTSGAAGMRKPDHNFFGHVLEKIALPAQEVVFVDDKQENVRAAKDMGLNGLVFDDSTVDTIKSIFYNPVARGLEYLYLNAKSFDSITNTGVVIADNFAELLILEATNDQSLVNVVPKPNETWNFFAGETKLVPGGYFPDDLDTTSLALTVLPPENTETVTGILDEMARCVNPDGMVLTYFDQKRPRTDSVVSANVLACFYQYGRGHQFPKTLQHIHDVLLNREYQHGTRYYPSPDCCLAFFGRLLHASNDGKVEVTLGSLLRSRLEERIGKSGNALDLAMRVLTCDLLDLECNVDREKLLHTQCADGSWEPGWMYRYGSTGVKIGNRGVTTALAVKAIGSSINPPGGSVSANGSVNGQYGDGNLEPLKT